MLRRSILPRTYDVRVGCGYICSSLGKMILRVPPLQYMYIPREHRRTTPFLGPLAGYSPNR